MNQTSHPGRTWLFVSFLLGLLFLLSSETAGQSESVEVLSIAGDTQNIPVNRYLSFYQEREAEFKPLDQLDKFTANNDSLVNIGFTSNKLWVQLPFSVLATADKSSKNWYLNLGLPHLKQLEYYHYIDGDLIEQFSGGTQLKFQQRSIQAPLWAMPVSLKPGKHLILLGLRSNAMIQSTFLLQSSEALFSDISQKILLQSLIIGFYSFLMLFNLIVYLSDREPEFLYGFGIILSLAIFQITYSGLGFQYLWPNYPELNNVMLRLPIGLTFAMLTLFTSAYLNVTAWSPLLARSMLATAALITAMSLLPVYGHAPIIAMIILFFGPVLSFSATAKAASMDIRGAKYLLVGMFISTVLVMLALLDFSGFRGEAIYSPIQFELGLMVMSLVIGYALAQLLSEEKLAAKRSELAAQAKSAFLASMSHEIRTPMNGVLGMLNLMLKGELNNQQQQYGQMARSSAESLLILLNDILDFSKIEAGKLDLEKLDFDLVELIQQTVTSESVKAQEKNLEIIVDLGKLDAVLVNGDPGRLRQILTNLINNAIKFTANGEIRIQVSTSAKNHFNQVELFCSVSDTGIGIAKNKLDQLFENFTQVETSTAREFGGTGLGLSISQRLVSLMHGTIGVSSNSGEGSKFWFTAKFSENFDDSIPANIIKLDLQGKEILLLEQNSSAAQIFKSYIEEWQGKLIWVKTEFEAISQLELNSHISHVFTNLLDAEELPAAISQVCQYRDIHHTVMTSITSEIAPGILSLHKIHSRIAKPIFPDLLLDILRHKASIPSLQVENLTHTSPREAKPDTISNDIKLLLVEDNLVNQQVALGILSGLKIPADIVSDGEMAIHILASAESPYSLILMDCQMPIMDGYESTRRIRAGEAGSEIQNIPIIAMTANAMLGDREKCLQSGMNDYLSKPVSAEALSRMLKHYLQYEHTVNSLETPGTEPNAVWDEQAALARVRGNWVYLSKTLEIFLEDTPSQISRLNELVAQSQVQEVAEVAHAIKGVAANLSGHRLFEVVSQMEVAAIAGDAGQLNCLLPDLNNEFKQLEDTMISSLRTNRH